MLLNLMPVASQLIAGFILTSSLLIKSFSALTALLNAALACCFIKTVSALFAYTSNFLVNRSRRREA